MRWAVSTVKDRVLNHRSLIREGYESGIECVREGKAAAVRLPACFWHLREAAAGLRRTRAAPLGKLNLNPLALRSYAPLCALKQIARGQCGLLDFEVAEVGTLPQALDEPIRFTAATGPGVGSIFRVGIFRYTD